MPPSYHCIKIFRMAGKTKYSNEGKKKLPVKNENRGISDEIEKLIKKTEGQNEALGRILNRETSKK